MNKGQEESKVQDLDMTVKKEDLDDSFEDIGGDYVNNIIKDDFIKETKGDVKVLINPDSRIVYDDYISAGASKQQPETFQKSEEESKENSSKSDSEIDWFRLYV